VAGLGADSATTSGGDQQCRAVDADGRSVTVEAVVTGVTTGASTADDEAERTARWYRQVPTSVRTTRATPAARPSFGEALIAAATTTAAAGPHLDA
jgi:hypothetical protein